jgi:hypothetical protein
LCFNVYIVCFVIQMKDTFKPIRVVVPELLEARLTRIAQRRFGTRHRKLPVLGSEAFVEYADRMEKALKLDPITPGEVSELVSKEAKAA